MTCNLFNKPVCAQRDHYVPEAGMSRARCLSLMFICL